MGILLTKIYKIMGKIYGLFGAMTGKTADVVMVVRNGEQIVRKYQPVVSNPSTPAQVEARAKLKMLSQLSAVMAPIIAIPRNGNVSTRNLFVKTNYGASNYSNNTAQINFSAIKITESVVGFPSINVTERTADTARVGIVLAGSQTLKGFDRIVYCCFAKQNDNALRFVDSKVVSDPGTGGIWGADFNVPAGECVVYAYGVRDNNEVAKAKYGSLVAESGEAFAKLVVTRALTEADITLSETAFVAIPTYSA